MTTLVKIGIFIVSVLVILAVALAILIQTQVTPEKVRETLLPLVEKSLQRDIEVGEVNIGLFSGISVADLKVMQKGSTEEFFSVKSVQLHYQFWPLLTGKVVVDQILLDYPQIYVTRLPDGQFNFSDLLPKSTVNKNSTTVSDSINGSKVLAVNFNLLVKEVNVNEGELQYVDRFENERSPFRYTLNKLNIKAKRITFDKPFPIDLSAVINDSNIDISGNYDLSRQQGDLTLHLAPIDVIPFAPYYRDSFSGKLGSARMALNLEVEIQPDLISSKGKIAFDNVDLVLNQFPETGLKQATLGVDYALNYNFGKQLLDVSTLLLHFNDINLGVEGELNLSSSDPFVVFTLLFDQFDLREVMQNLPMELSRDYQKYSFAGVIDGQVDFAGKLSSGLNLLKSAELSLSDIRASAENFRAGISGDISYNDKVLQTENLLLQYGDQQAQLQLKAEKSATDIFFGDFVLTADILNLNKILPESGGKITRASKKASNLPQIKRQKTWADEIDPIDIPIAMDGKLAVNRFIYKELNIDKVTADLSLKKNRLSIRNLSSKIGGGGLKASSFINFGVKGFAYQGEIALNQPNAMTLVRGLFPETEHSVSGQLQWQSSFSGRGTLPDNLLRALQLKGEFNLQNGEAKGSPVIEGMADFLGNSDLKILSFQTLTGQYNLHDGLARINGHLGSSKTKLTSTGTINIDGRLNLQLDTRFAPEIMNKLRVGKSLKQSISDQDGWGYLPLQIQGTLSYPKVGYDSVVLQNQVIDKAKEKVSQKLLDTIAPGAGGEVEPIKKMLDNTLNKLFGK